MSEQPMVTADMLEELAEKLDRIRAALEGMRGGPQRALLVLLADHTRVSRRDIKEILDALDGYDFIEKYFGGGASE